MKDKKYYGRCLACNHEIKEPVMDNKEPPEFCNECYSESMENLNSILPKKENK